MAAMTAAAMAAMAAMAIVVVFKVPSLAAMVKRWGRIYRKPWVFTYFTCSHSEVYG
jgi:hypothetical protein